MAEQRYSQNAPIPYQRTFAAEQLDKQKLTKTVNGEKLETTLTQDCPSLFQLSRSTL